MALHSGRDSQPDGMAWARLLRLTSACGRSLRRVIEQCLGALELSETEFLLLFTCLDGPPEGTAQIELAAALEVSPGQISGVVDRLREAGWIQPHRAPRDRRRQLWRLTPAGQERLKAACGELAALTSGFDQEMSPLERGQVERLMNVLLRVCRAITGDGAAIRLMGNGKEAA